MATLRNARLSLLKLVEPLKGPIPSAILAGLVITSIVAASLLIDEGAQNSIYFSKVQSQWRGLAAFLGVFIGGGFCGLLFSGIGQSGLKESASCFWVSVKDSTILLGTAGCLALALIVWWVSARSSSPLDHKLYLIQHDPGGIFAAFMGFVTIVGFAFTLHDLREMRRRITTFPDLIDRLSAMLNKVDGDEVVRVLAYTPALGYIALEDSEFKSFYATLVRKKKSNGEPCAEIICLNKRDLKDWHALFIGRRTRRKRFERDDAPAGGSSLPQDRVEAGIVSRKLTDAATKKSENIIRDFVVEDDDSEEQQERVKRLPFEFLPGYYFFLSADRAIIVAPLQLPFPKGAPRSTQQSLRGTVQMLGFETNDRAIIRDLRDLYDNYKSLPSSYVAEVRVPIPATKLTAWCQSPELCNGAMNELIRQFNVASGAGGQAADMNPEDRTRNQDYSTYFKKDPNAELEVTFRVALKEEAHD